MNNNIRPLSKTSFLKNKGQFFVFEGIDKAGKDTQAKLLADYLSKEGYDLVLTQEPTDGPIGQEIKKILKFDSDSKPLDPRELQNLFIKDRREHQKVIRKAIENGEIIISTRYFFSTIAYGILDGLDYQTLFNLNKDFLYPDQIFLLDLPAQVAIARLKLNNEKPEYFEKEKNLAIVRQEYLKMSSNLPSFQVIDANQDRQFIAREIRNYFYDLPPTT